jgi:hypothetical protein
MPAPSITHHAHKLRVSRQTPVVRCPNLDRFGAREPKQTHWLKRTPEEWRALARANARPPLRLRLTAARERSRPQGSSDSMRGESPASFIEGDMRPTHVRARKALGRNKRRPRSLRAMIDLPYQTRQAFSRIIGEGAVQPNAFANSAELLTAPITRYRPAECGSVCAS